MTTQREHGERFMAANFGAWYDYETVSLVGQRATNSDYEELACRAGETCGTFESRVDFGMGMAAEYDRMYGARVSDEAEESDAEYGL